MEKQSYIQRLQDAAHGGTTDRPPCICPGGMMNMIVDEAMEAANSFWPEAHCNPQKMAALAKVMRQNGGFENYGVPFCMTVEAEAMGAVVDLGGAHVEPHVTYSPLHSSGEADRLTSMDLTQGRPHCVLEAIRMLKQENDGVPTIGNVTGPVSVAGTLVDMTALLKEMRKSPESCVHLLERITHELIRYARAQIEAGADVLCISEPSGTGEILGARHFQTYALPYINQILDAVEAPVKIVHICGRLHSIYGLLDQIHCDVFSFDAMVQPEEIRPYLGNKAVMGNISTHALGTMQPEWVAALTKTALKNGVDIVSPACGLPVTAPFQNIQAMVQTVQTYKRTGS